MSIKVKELIIYGDKISQPTRSVLQFCNLSKIKYTFTQILIEKGEHKSSEFKKINPLGKLPAIKIIQDNDTEFNLHESAAILKFLSAIYKTPEHWYNREDIKRRALIDQYIDYHHGNTRLACTGTFFNEYFYPIFVKRGVKVNKAPIENTNMLPKVLKFINEQMSNKNFIIDDEMTIADLLLYNELIQLYSINYDFSQWMNIYNFMSRMSNYKEITEENEIIRKMTNKCGFYPKF